MSQETDDDCLKLALIDSSLDAMFQIDESGTIQLANKAVHEHFGWTREELIGQNISIIVGKEHAHKHDEYIRQYLRTGKKRVMGLRRHLPARRKDGSEFTIELGLTEVKGKNGKLLFCGFARDLTEHEEDVKRLSIMKNVTVGLVDSSLDPMFQIDDHGIIQLVNQAATDQFGWSEKEFLGQNISMIVGGGHGPRHDQYLKQYLKTGIKRVMGKRRELPAKRKDGSEFMIELGLTEVKPSAGTRRFCGFVHDLTRRKANEARIRQKEAFMNNVIEASFDAMFAIDEKGIIRQVNGAAVKQFGWSKEEFLGSNISMIMTSKDEKNHDRYIERYLQTGKKKLIGIQRELQAKKKDGSTFPIWLGLDEVEGPEGSQMFVAFVRDLTYLKRVMTLERSKAAAETLIRNSVPDDLMSCDSNGSHADELLIATVLYAEISGMDSSMEAAALATDAAAALKNIYDELDRLVDKYHLKKVKSKGNCCMISSAPVTEFEETECLYVCQFACEMVKALRKHNREVYWYQLDMRIGIITGPVDVNQSLWIEAVNLASSIEYSKVPGTVLVSRTVVDLVGEDFIFAAGPSVPVEGKRDIDSYILKGEATHLEEQHLSRRTSQADEGESTSERFWKPVGNLFSNLSSEKE